MAHTSSSDFFFEPIYRPYIDSGDRRDELYSQLTEKSRLAFRIYAALTVLALLPMFYGLTHAWDWHKMRTRSVKLPGQILKIEAAQDGKAEVQYSYRYTLKELKGTALVPETRAKRYKVGEQLKLLVDASHPTHSLLERDSDLVSVVTWFPEVMALAGVFLLPWPILLIERGRMSRLAQQGVYVAGIVEKAEVVSNPGAPRVLSVTFRLESEDGQLILRERRKSERALPEPDCKIWLLFLDEGNCRIL